MSENDPIGVKRGIADLEEVLQQESVRTWLSSDSLPQSWDVEGLARALEERVYAQVPRPWPLLPRELAECVRDQVVVHKESGFDLNYVRLLTVVRRRCDYRDTDFSISMPLPILRWAKVERPIQLRTLPSGADIIWYALRREHFGLDSDANELTGVQASFRLHGYHTADAAQQAADSISELLCSLCPLMFNYGLFNLSGRLNNLLGPEYAYGGSAEAVEAHLEWADTERTAEEPEDEIEAAEQILALSNDVHNVMGFVADLIEVVHLPQLGKKDTGTFERRLANAVDLVVCASRLSVPSVTLALYIAAVEALVCSRDEGIAEELSNNCATLLLPDSHSRIRAIRALKKLYGVRSKALHGEKLGATLSEVARAQELCGALFTAVMEWKKFQERIEMSGSRQSLLEAINEAKITGRPLTGVPERLEAGLNWVRRMEAPGNQSQP